MFVDTAGWGNIVDRSQDFYAQATAPYRTAWQQRHRVVTTNYILAEVVALLTSPLRIPRPSVAAFINSLKTSPYIEILHVDAALDEQAWQLLAQRQDKAWGLVHCASFFVMQQQGITDALTTDHHFEQAGFVCLLRNTWLRLRFFALQAVRFGL